MQPVCYSKRLAAVALDDRAYFFGGLETFEPDHPRFRFVAAMCLYARAVAIGVAPQPYRDEDAELSARASLIPDDEFCEFDAAPDVDLAEYFNVPLEQVVRKRADLVSPKRARFAYLIVAAT